MPATTCMIQPEAGRTCRDPAHIVLFALGGEFAGRTYQPGQHMLVCLTHGNHILDARRSIDGRGVPLVAGAGWLNPYTNRLPLTRLPQHDQPTPTPRPAWNPPHRRRRDEAGRGIPADRVIVDELTEGATQRPQTTTPRGRERRRYERT